MYLVNPENSETLLDLKRRINMFFRLLEEQQLDTDRILVVSHNGILRIIRQYYMFDYEKIETKNLNGFTYVLKK